MQAAPVNLFQQWIKWIWKPSISITQSSVRHVLLYIICVRNKFSLFFSGICVRGRQIFIVSDVHMYVNKNLDLCDQRVLCACAPCATMCRCVLWDSCACRLHVYICLSVASCMRRCQSIKGVWGHTDSLVFFTFATLEKQRATLESMSRLQRSSEATLL